MRRTRIVIFAKAPVPGSAKTRLIPALGAVGAARLAKTMLDRTVAEAAVATDWLPSGELSVHLGDATVRFGTDVAPVVAALLEDDSPDTWTAADLTQDERFADVLAAGADGATAAALALVTDLVSTGMAKRAA